MIHLDTNYLIGLLVRGSRFDCLIAATAILNQADLATLNQADFKVFAAHGLNLR
jgi:predicted nucleic acid-binding protein